MASVEADEIGNVVVATGRGDLGDGEIGGQQKLFCVIETEMVEVLLEGHARGPLEPTWEIAVADVEMRGQGSFVQLLGEMTVQINDQTAVTVGGMGVRIRLLRCLTRVAAIAQQTQDQCRDMAFHGNLGAVALPLKFLGKMLHVIQRRCPFR